jgi:hypothetical protein
MFGFHQRQIQRHHFSNNKTIIFKVAFVSYFPSSRSAYSSLCIPITAMLCLLHSTTFVTPYRNKCYSTSRTDFLCESSEHDKSFTFTREHRKHGNSVTLK